MMKSISISQIRGEEIMENTSLLAYSSLASYSKKNEGENEDEVTDRNIRALLSQKEKDLILAAELGKALLEKNEDLSQQNEKMTEEFSKQIEHLEQERHRLRQQLELMEDEYEQRLMELQSDIDTLRSKLDESDSSSKLNERERSNLVSQLTEQNQRLTSELQESASREQDLQTRINQLREQVTDKRITVQDHVTHLEILRDEIELVTNRKNELQKKVDQLIADKKSLNSVLEETSEKLVLLERINREQENQIRNNDRELSELRTNNHVLSERLENLSRSFNSYSHTSSSVQMSLLNEMEMSTSGSDSDRSLHLRRPCSQIDEEDHEDELGSSLEGGNSGLEDDSELTYVHQGVEIKQLKEEMLSAYHQMRSLCCQIHQQQLKAHHNNRRLKRHNSQDSLDTTSSSEDFTHHQSSSSLQIGLLNDAVLELKGLCINLINESKNCPYCRAMEGNGGASSEENCNQMTLALKQKDEEIKKRDEQISSLESQLSVLKVQLTAAEDQCKTLRQDIEDSALSQDTLVKKAWESRDLAVQRKNSAEIELAKERVASMQVNSQLLEAIQQKIELSQQLDQWQVDMEQLLEGQMRERLLLGESSKSAVMVTGARATSSSAMSTCSDSSDPGSRTASRILGFFQLSKFGE